MVGARLGVQGGEVARRIVRIDRLIAVLAAAVLLLGALAVWRLVETRTFARETPVERVARQLRDYDASLRLFDMTAAQTHGVVCGYAGTPAAAPRNGQPPPLPTVVRFISRPNRLLTSRDPLSGEFAEQVSRECPRYFVSPPIRS